MRVIYLAAYEALHPDFDVVYQDINGKRDLGGCMLDVDLTPYDFIIATPPCNFWSIARGNRCSKYSLDTKHLLPDIIEKLAATGKPYVVENVINKKDLQKTAFMIWHRKQVVTFIILAGTHTLLT